MSVKTGQVFVYRIARPSASKITEIINGKNQKRLNQTKIDGKIKETFQVPLSASTRKLATGLDREVDNPLKGEQINNPQFQFLATQDKALLQHLIEYKYNFEKGYLSSLPADINNKKHLESPSFYQTFRYKCNDGLTVLTLSNIDNLLAYYSMLEHHKFANSKKEWEAGKFPYADYYLAEMDETENEKYSKKQYKDKAKSELMLGKVADSDTQKKFVKLLIPQISKGRLTDAQAYNALSEGIDNNERYKDGEEFIVKFNRLCKLLQDAPGKTRFNALVLLQESINTYLVTDKGGTYTWVAKDVIIGASKEKAIDWIIDPNKADLVQELQEQVMSQKGKYELV